MSIWKDEHIMLRSIEPSDWEFFYAFSEDADNARFYDEILIPASKDKMKKWCEETSLACHAKDETILVIESLDGKMVGLVDIFDCVKRNGIFKYGIGIHKDCQRKGFASKAIRLLLKYYFFELRYQKVNVLINTFNQPSIELHKNLGFLQEGCLKSMVYTRGAYFDELIFGLTIDEFRNSL